MCVRACGLYCNLFHRAFSSPVRLALLQEMKEHIETVQQEVTTMNRVRARARFGLP
jgi:hypothetical protein